MGPPFVDLPLVAAASSLPLPVPVCRQTLFPDHDRGTRPPDVLYPFFTHARPASRRRYRRHLHRRRRLRRDDRRAAVRQGAVDARRIWSTASATGVEKAGTRLSPTAELFLHGSTIAINTHAGAHRRQDRAADHRRLSRHLRDRPHQPAGRLQPVLPQARAAGRARAALRGRRSACAPTARSHKRARRGAGRARSATSLKRRGIEAVAILLPALLPQPGARAARQGDRRRQSLPGAFVSRLARAVAGIPRVRARSTVVANAYVGPRVRRYLGEIDSHIRRRRLRRLVPDRAIDRRPLTSRAGAGRECVRMLESGPAAGVIGAQAICAARSASTTPSPSTWAAPRPRPASSSNGEPLTTGAALIGGYEQALPIQIPMMDIFEVGTGGGSIARVDDGNALRVGPQSAGAHAGPGLLRPRRHGADRDRRQPGARPARRRPLPRRRDEARRRRPRERALQAQVGEPLGLDVDRRPPTASCASPSTAMSYAVKGVTTERGLDAGDFAHGGLWRRGAAACRRRSPARSASARSSSRPRRAFLGLRHAVLRPALRLRALLVRRGSTTRSFDEIEAVYRRAGGRGPRRHRASTSSSPTRSTVEARRRHALCRPGACRHGRPADERVRRRRTATAIKQHFDEMHLQRYGTSAPDEPAEIVSLRITVTGRHEEAAAGEDRARRADAADSRAARHARRSISATGGFVDDADLRARRAARRQPASAGPALIEEHASTTVLHAGRPADASTPRQSRHRRSGATLMHEHSRPARKTARGRSGRSSRSCATACSP